MDNGNCTYLCKVMRHMYVRGLVNFTSRQIVVCVRVGIIEPKEMNVLISKDKLSDFVLNCELVCPSFIEVLG